MQLIIETEKISIGINEKMSSVDTETLAEVDDKNIPNGDVEMHTVMKKNSENNINEDVHVIAGQEVGDTEKETEVKTVDNTDNHETNVDTDDTNTIKNRVTNGEISVESHSDIQNEIKSDNDTLSAVLKNVDDNVNMSEPVSDVVDILDSNLSGTEVCKEKNDECETDVNPSICENGDTVDQNPERALIIVNDNSNKNSLLNESLPEDVKESDTNGTKPVTNIDSNHTEIMECDDADLSFTKENDIVPQLLNSSALSTTAVVEGEKPHIKECNELNKKKLTEDESAINCNGSSQIIVSEVSEETAVSECIDNTDSMDVDENKGETEIETAFNTTSDQATIESEASNSQKESNLPINDQQAQAQAHAVAIEEEVNKIISEQSNIIRTEPSNDKSDTNSTEMEENNKIDTEQANTKQEIEAHNKIDTELNSEIETGQTNPDEDPNNVTAVSKIDHCEALTNESPMEISSDDILEINTEREVLDVNEDIKKLTDSVNEDLSKENVMDSDVEEIEIIDDKNNTERELLNVNEDVKKLTDSVNVDPSKENVMDSDVEETEIIDDKNNTERELLNVNEDVKKLTNPVKEVETVKDIECKNNTELVVSNVSENGNNLTNPDNEVLSKENKKDSDIEEAKDILDKNIHPSKETEKPELEKKVEKKVTPTIKLSNTLDILSDDEEEELPKVERTKEPLVSNEKQCINIDDDDDIMLIDYPTTLTETKISNNGVTGETKTENSAVEVDESKTSEAKDSMIAKNESPVIDVHVEKVSEKKDDKEAILETKQDKPDTLKPLLPDDFLKSNKKNLAHMSRDELEEFCILKIVESIIDRSSMNETKTKLKSMAQNIEEFKTKIRMLTKQNRDLQVVLKSVQEEQKKGGDGPVVPLKITRSVGMQVLMTDKSVRRKGFPGQPTSMNNLPNTNSARSGKNSAQTRQQTLVPVTSTPQQIPVPRLVPAVQTNPTIKAPSAPQQSPVKTPTKNSSPMNGVKLPSIAAKADKRPHNKMATVDLTDDEPAAEPPSKVRPRASPQANTPVRVIPSQNLMNQRPTIPTAVNNNHRKVFIPISGTQPQGVRPGQAIMLKSVPPQGPRTRAPPGPMVRIPQNSVRMGRAPSGRHPAPLPDVVKQYQPPNWKALPPAPDLKLSKVDNGIVISWKIEGYQEDSYEEIASYQLYAYQETSSPPNISLWKKIGDVKALPLPMACTLTQFMAGYKYYFAVRAVDVKSRLGPFSLPGSILLLNKGY